MLRNLIRSLVIRSLITIGLNLSRSQLLKRNSRLNRLLSIINLDINRGLTISRLRGELSLTSTQNSLTVLRHQLRIQVILLTNNQTLISHSVSNNRTINNTSRALSKLSLSLNRRLQSLLRVNSLSLILEILVLRNLIRSLVIRSLITIGLNLSRGQLLKRNSRLNRLLSIINLDINRGLTISRLRGELSLTSTQNSLTVLRHQLRIQVILLTNNQTLISHSVSNNRTINNTSRALSKLSLSLNRRLLSRWIRAVSAVTRQTRLIRGKYALITFQRSVVRSQITFRSDNCDVSTFWGFRNGNRRIPFQNKRSASVRILLNDESS